jgi:hypothetical protein
MVKRWESFRCFMLQLRAVPGSQKTGYHGHKSGLPIHDCHEASLPKLFCQQALAEQIRLKSTLRGNLREIHCAGSLAYPFTENH